MATAPDGKVLAAGEFNNYNGEPVGGLIRLNSDGSLDTSFNNHVMGSGLAVKSILIQPDGKIVIHVYYGQFTNLIFRLTANGNPDPSFNPTISLTGRQCQVAIDADGRVVVAGEIPRRIVRLNDDGSIDNSFTDPHVDVVFALTAQGNRLLHGVNTIYRLNEDGSPDTTFLSTFINGEIINDLRVQPDGKILVLTTWSIFRVNENGGIDPSFQSQQFAGSPQKVLLNGDGRITLALGMNNPIGMTVIRLLPDGTPDSSYLPYQYFGRQFWGHTLLSDGSVLIGGGTPAGSSQNDFKKLLPDGGIDLSFNPNGTGFQNIDPCRIRTIEPANGKVLFAGTFDLVNGVVKRKIAVLNEDGSLDTSFGLNTTPTGNYFSQISDLYHANHLSDGKVIISGGFIYFLNGVQKNNVVRLNQDGSIDGTFNLGPFIGDFVVNAGGGTNKIVETAEGKLVVGNSRPGSGSTPIVPLRLNTDGSRDMSFAPTLFSGQGTAIDDIAQLPDGRILIAGRTVVQTGPTQQVDHGFVARLNADGSTDPTFQIYDVPESRVSVMARLNDGKLVIGRRVGPSNAVSRLLSDGNIDTSFVEGTADGPINAIATLTNGQILVGGRFSTYAGQARRNLALLNADGSLAENPGNFNDEILTIAVDDQGRILFGGLFTSVGNTTAPYIARMTTGASQVARTSFDYDGDGRADTSVFRPISGNWYLNRSTAGFTGVSFGNATDKIAPADFDGDGKTDVAVYRPGNGTWYWLNSSNGAFNASQFGSAEDLPVPGDYDGDGRADLTVFRPSNGVWYRLNSSNGSFFAVEFGASEDKPTIGDFDGDGKADIAVWRPSNGAWYRLNSSNGQFVAVGFGLSTDLITPADFDGDGKTDVAVYRPSTGTWYSLDSSNGALRATQFGTAGDLPTAADYDGDGRADVSVFRPSNGVWYRLNSGNASFFAVQFGVNGDKPTPAAFRY